jgi:hypothetical protein
MTEPRTDSDSEGSPMESEPTMKDDGVIEVAQSPGGTRRAVNVGMLQVAVDRIRSRFDQAPGPIQQQLVHCFEKLAAFSESSFSGVFPLKDVQGMINIFRIHHF